MRLPLSLLLFACLIALVAAAPKATAPAPALIATLAIYNPPQQFEARIAGEGGKDLARYVKELVTIAGEFATDHPKPRPTGVFIAVAFKPNKQARLWLEATEGEISPEQLKELQAKLAKIPAPLLKGQLGLGFGISFFGAETSFQSYPTAWAKATEAAGKRVPLDPDELFKLIWPEPAIADTEE
jgi:hypothetical protein